MSECSERLLSLNGRTKRGAGAIKQTVCRRKLLTAAGVKPPESTLTFIKCVEGI